MITFIRKPVDGSLPFISADGHDVVEVIRSLKRFAQIVNGGTVADEIRLHPLQVRDRAFEQGIADINLLLPKGMLVRVDPQLLPTEAVLYAKGISVAAVRNLSVPVSKQVKDAAAVSQNQKLAQVRALREEADRLESTAKSLRKRAESLSS